MNIHAVRLADNTNPKAHDQIADAGRSYEDCLKAARLYVETSRYQTIEVLELQIVNAERVRL